MAGNGPAPLFVLCLLEGLPDTSMWHAKRMGGMEYMGWGEDRQLSATMHDLLSVLMVISGNWKKGKEPKVEPWHRPGTKKNAANKKSAKRTVKDLYNSMRRG